MHDAETLGAVRLVQGLRILMEGLCTIANQASFQIKAHKQAQAEKRREHHGHQSDCKQHGNTTDTAYTIECSDLVLYMTSYMI